MVVSDRLQPQRSTVLAHAPKHGFVTWVIRNPEYIAPALVLAHSLRTHCPGIPRVLLLDKNLVRPGGPLLQALRSVYTDVVFIKPFKIPTQHMKWTRFEEKYTPWIDYCFTRLYALNLGSLLGLEKVLVMDVDTLVFRDISDLFNLPCPAGILSIPEKTSIKGEECAAAGLLDTDHCFRHGLAHGKPIPTSILEYSISAFWGIRGALMLLECNEDHYKDCIAFLERTKKPYGRIDVYLGPDELFFSLDYLKIIGNGRRWTHIHQRYCCTAWHFEDQLDSHTEWPLACHFVSQKPWQGNAQYWDDFDLWYAEAAQLVSLNEDLYGPFFRGSFLPRPKRKTVTAHSPDLLALWSMDNNNNIVSTRTSATTTTNNTSPTIRTNKWNKRHNNNNNNNRDTQTRASNRFSRDSKAADEDDNWRRRTPQ